MSKRSFLEVALILAMILSVNALIRAQGPQHSLQGKVHYPNGSAPANPVKITLTFNGRPIYEAFTDLSGRFSFTGLRRGMYQLIADGDGQTFETTRVNAEVSAYGSAPQSFTQNIQLQLIAGKSTPPASVTSVEAADPSIPARAREEYAKGMKDAQEDKPEKAALHFREAITVHPPFYLARVALAEQCSKLKRDGDAAQAYQEAIEMKPDRAPAYVGLGVLLVKLKKYNEAISPLRRSLEIEKQSSTPYLFLGLAEMMTGDYQSSEANLLRAYEIGKPALAHIYLANLYELKGDPAKAIEQLKAFLKENPNLSQERQTDINGAIDKLKKQANRKKD